jgi:hypothetical protein
LAIVFAVSIQGTSLVPCVSSLEEAPGLAVLGVLSWYMAWADAAVLAVTAAGLLHDGAFRAARVVAAVGLALAGFYFALGATQYYLVARAAILVNPFVAMSEARTPPWLIGGVALAVLGATVARVRQRQGEARGGAA